MDWMRKFPLTIGRIQLAEDNQSEREKEFNRLPDLFENDETIKETELNILLNRDITRLNKKAGPVLLHQ